MLLRIILILVIPFLSIICSLMSSGIENVITANNKDWNTIPIFYWIFFWSIFWFVLYRTKFGSTKKLKIFILRSIINVRTKYLSLNLGEKATELNDMQKKSIQTWNLLLKDKNSELLSCQVTTRRMIIRGDSICVISANNETNLMFIRLGKDSIYYDVWLPNGLVSEIFNSFDKEQKVRFQKTIDEARSKVIF